MFRVRKIFYPAIMDLFEYKDNYNVTIFLLHTNAVLLSFLFFKES